MDNFRTTHTHPKRGHAVRPEEVIAAVVVYKLWLRNNKANQRDGNRHWLGIGFWSENSAHYNQVQLSFDSAGILSSKLSNLQHLACSSLKEKAPRNPTNRKPSGKLERSEIEPQKILLQSILHVVVSIRQMREYALCKIFSSSLMDDQQRNPYTFSHYSDFVNHPQKKHTLNPRGNDPDPLSRPL